MNAPASAEVEQAVDVKTLNVYQRINEIKKAVKYIQKDKKVESYMAVTHDAVTALTHDHFVAWGVIIEPHEVSSVTVLSGMTTGKGIPYVRFEGKYRIDFINVDEPQQKASIELTAHALDHGDKAPGKSLSYATKGAVLKLLQLESGETEADEARPQDVKIAKDKDKITPTAGAVERLPEARREYTSRIASTIVDCFEAGLIDEAYKAYTEVTDTDEKVAVWSYLDSKMRRELKRLDAEKRKP
jgi:hypothetical protein